MTSISKKLIGCIGICTSELSSIELDIITDDVNKTVNHTKGRHIFREFLRKGNYIDDLTCLEFYEKICGYIENDANYVRYTTQPCLEFLIASVNEALDIAVDLNGIPEIDLALLERYSECLTIPRRELMLDVLVETKHRLAHHLVNAHNDFKIYVLQPCPKNK